LSNIIARFLVATIVGGSILGYLAPAAQACKCAPPLSVSQSIKRSTMVFRGKVLAVATLKNDKGYNYRQVKFVLKRVWKGPTQPYVSLTTGIGDGDCGYDFVKGQEYLVYAMGNIQDMTNKNCGRTKSWQSVDRQELRQLGKGTETPWD
jgi:hypothetical protein